MAVSTFLAKQLSQSLFGKPHLTLQSRAKQALQTGDFGGFKSSMDSLRDLAKENNTHALEAFRELYSELNPSFDRIMAGYEVDPGILNLQITEEQFNNYQQEQAATKPEL